MKRISRNLFFLKNIFPVVWFGFLGIFIYEAVTHLGGKSSLPPQMLIGPVFMVVIGVVVFKRLIFDLADDVWDEGDALVVRKGGDECRIYLENIMNVSSSTAANPPRITLTLREPCKLGKDIIFSPRRRSFFSSFYTMHPVARELMERVDAARRG